VSGVSWRSSLSISAQGGHAIIRALSQSFMIPPTRLERVIGARINWNCFGVYMGTGQYVHTYVRQRHLVIGDTDTDDSSSEESS
jgi:hypothetical protein